MTSTQLMIEGPAGKLEAVITQPQNPCRLNVIICHPHPQYGGTFQDSVVTTCCNAFVSTVHAACLRFNFRGVGQSAGQYSGGKGETEDLLAVMQWLEHHQPQRPLWLVGYSFGSWIVSQALASADLCLPVAQALLIAPPMTVLDYPPKVDIPVPVDIIYGSNDPLVEAEALQTWLGDTTSLHAITEGDHFFSGSYRALQAQLNTLFAQHDIVTDIKPAP